MICSHTITVLNRVEMVIRQLLAYQKDEMMARTLFFYIRTIENLPLCVNNKAKSAKGLALKWPENTFRL